MDLIVISGFLGSGKTTLLLALAKHFSAAGRKVAIIENEVGKDGIDGELLKAEGLSVREIYSGCICCSLRHDLIQTLLELERDYQPDLVFLEPSGVASPKQIQRAFDGYGGEIDGKLVIIVADAERLPAIEDFSMPLIRDGLEIADLVVLNKADLVSSAELAQLQERIRLVNPKVEQLSLCAHRPADLAQLVANVAARALPKPPPAVAHPAEEDLPPAAIFAATIELARPPATALSLVQDSLHQLSLELSPDDGILIGHLKAIVKTEPLGYAVFSVTGHAQNAVQKGSLPRTITRAKVIINAIVYGMANDAFATLCQTHIHRLETELKEGC